jgi:pyridoxamine 5'-phosphate oxidase-like protein
MRKESAMKHEEVAEVLGQPISQELLSSSIPTRLAYAGVDGAPRVIPIAFFWTGEHLVVNTAPKAAKVRALRENPKVALTIDTQDQWPPRALLIRGTAQVDLVDEIPDSYIEASRKVIPIEYFDDWEQGVRALYDQMARITIAPDWAKLLDFESTIPKAVEDLVKARQGGDDESNS